MHLPIRAAAVAAAFLAGVGLLVSAGQQGETSGGAALSRFSALRSADVDQGVRIRQIRRVPDENGIMVGVTEQLEVRPWDDHFDLVPVIEPEASETAEFAELVQRYRDHAGFIHHYQSFRVHDAARAARNYTYWPLDTSVRAGRAVDRVLVIPKVLDRSVWLLELDQATGYPLFRAEFSASLELVGELEVLQFQPLAPPGTSSPVRRGSSGASGSGWVPMFTITDYPSAADARQALGTQGDAMELPLGAGLSVGYGNHRNFVSEHLFDMRRKVLVTMFTDGVDHVFFLQDEGVDPLAALPAQQANPVTEQKSQTVLRFVDQNVRQYTFHERGVLCVLVGRGSQIALDDACREFVGQFVH